MFLHFEDLRDGRGGIDTLKVLRYGTILVSLGYVVVVVDMPEPLGAPIESSGHPCFQVDNCLLRPYSCWEWDVRAVSQWLITSDVQPLSLHSVDQPHGPSLCPLFEQLQEVGMAFFRFSLILLAWRRASCLWPAQGLCTPQWRLGCPSKAGP